MADDAAPTAAAPLSSGLASAHPVSRARVHFSLAAAVEPSHGSTAPLIGANSPRLPMRSPTSIASPNLTPSAHAIGGE